MKEYRDSKHINFKYAKGNVDVYGKTFHTCYELYLLLNGDVEFISSHTRQILKPYQLMIIPPGEYHQFRVLGEVANYERCVLNMDLDFLEAETLRQAFFGKELLTLSRNHRIVQHYLYLISCLSGVCQSDFASILPSVGTDIVFLVKNHAMAADIPCGSLRPASVELIGYIDAHYREPLDLAELSQVFHFSVSSLCHIFKESFGISIKKYILQKRMSTAHMALQQGKHPEAVCTECGFSNYATFYRAYKNHFHMSPSQCVTHKR